MLSDTNQTDQFPIACVPQALTAGQRARWLELGAKLYPAVQEVRELPDGYGLRLPNDAETLMLAAEDLSLERLCCPFFRLTLEIEPNEGPLWFGLTGREGVKEFLRLSFESASLIPEYVARAAGFNIANRADIDSEASSLEVVELINDRFRAL